MSTLVLKLPVLYAVCDAKLCFQLFAFEAVKGVLKLPCLASLCES